MTATDAAKMAPMSAPAAVTLRRDPERGIIARRGGRARSPARDRPDHPPRRLRRHDAGRRRRGSAGYMLGWALMPPDGSARAPVERIVARRDTWLIVAGAVCLAARRAAAPAALGPVVQRRDRVAGDAGRRRRRADLAPGRRCRRRRPRPRRATAARTPSLPALRLPADALGRALVGAALVVGGGARVPVAQRRAAPGARRAARGRRGRRRTDVDPRAVVAAARARAERRARRADPLPGARRGRRAPARLRAADAGADAEARRRPARGGGARPPPGARAAGVAERPPRRPAS